MPRTLRVASFAPELLELYRRAAREPVSITLSNLKAAQRLRYRLHTLRAAMRAESHNLTSIAEKVQFTLTSNEVDDEVILTARPADDNFLPAIRRAGVNIEDMPMGEVEEATASNDAFKKYLAKQGGKLHE